LAADIAVNGVINALCVRTHGDGYQIMAGHNRRDAAALAGLKTVPCVIKEVDDDTAAIIVVTTNLNQREKLLPSEKAYAYKMQLNALKHQGKSTSAQVEPKLRSNEQVAEKNDESRAQIQRYIRLTYLVPKLLEMVDEETISFMAGVNLSYHHPDLQRELLEFLDANELTKISLKQSEEIKKLSNMKHERLMQIFGLVRETSKPKKLTGKKTVNTIDSFFAGTGMTDAEIAEIIANLLNTHYKKDDEPHEGA
jgi:ParB family chromosome partitioning protein